ncbi:hypothetical protein PIB30_037889 [Stylosanthes scabra]|uniref:Transposase MuDR plant domain-containing protein n=1 Tax=Stylosanthes scabra TaxID=79078 RepID=A0ABU6ZCM7_9FABA|nr:hypothetical protein [Stylosanthes scabra]
MGLRKGSLKLDILMLGGGGPSGDNDHAGGEVGQNEEAGGEVDGPNVQNANGGVGDDAPNGQNVEGAGEEVPQHVKNEELLVEEEEANLENMNGVAEAVGPSGDGVNVVSNDEATTGAGYGEVESRDESGQNDDAEDVVGEVDSQDEAGHNDEAEDVVGEGMKQWTRGCKRATMTATMQNMCLLQKRLTVSTTLTSSTVRNGVAEAVGPSGDGVNVVSNDEATTGTGSGEVESRDESGQNDDAKDVVGEVDSRDEAGHNDEAEDVVGEGDETMDERLQESDDDSDDAEYVPPAEEADSVNDAHFIDSEEELDLDDTFFGVQGEAGANSADDKGKRVVNEDFDAEGEDSEELDECYAVGGYDREDADDEGGDSERMEFPVHRPLPNMAEYRWVLGIVYALKEEFKNAVTSHTVYSKRGIKFQKVDRKHVFVNCQE